MAHIATIGANTGGLPTAAENNFFINIKRGSTGPLFQKLALKLIRLNCLKF
jgi:hypothetical protein